MPKFDLDTYMSLLHVYGSYMGFLYMTWVEATWAMVGI